VLIRWCSVNFVITDKFSDRLDIPTHLRTHTLSRSKDKHKQLTRHKLQFFAITVRNLPTMPILNDITNVKQFSCPQCDAKFDSRSKKEIHVDRNHKQSKEIKYADGTFRLIVKNEDGQVICACGKSYDYFKSLERHVRKDKCEGDKRGILKLNQNNKNHEGISNGKSICWFCLLITDITMQLMERSHHKSEMVCYLPKFEVAVCTECQHALNAPPGISRHLITAHLWSAAEAKAIDQQFVDKVIRSPSDPNCVWIIPKPEDLSIPHLSLHKDGFGCHLCTFVCRTKQSIINHYSVRHRDKVHSQPLKQLYKRNVSVQSYTKAGPHNRCFEVNRKSNKSDSNINSSALPFDAASAEIRKQLHLQMQQRSNTVRESLSIIQQSKDRREVSPWLERTKWIAHLEGYDARQIAKLVELPKKGERFLITVCDGFKRAILEAKQMVTSQTISQFDLKQINSFDRHKSFSRPLNMTIQDSTFNFYVSVWQKLLCYLIRTSHPDDRENPPPLLYQLTATQKTALTELVVMVNLYLKIPVLDVAYKSAVGNVNRTSVNISIRLLDHILHGSEYESVIVSFLAASGIDPDKGVFKDIGVCTRDLSAIIKIGQLLVIRQSVYEVERGRVDYPSTAIEEMRIQFMTYDGRTPMGWIHGLRAYGTKLLANRTVDGDISWSDDLETVCYKEFQCSMTNFRKFVTALSEKAQRQLAELFLVQEGESLGDVAPAVRLFAIKDNPKESKAQWNFLKHDGNEHLFDGSTWMIDRITGNANLFQQFFENKTEVVWRSATVNNYLKSASAFLETLFLYIHITSGQPARVTEELGIRYCNTMSGEHRNIFIDNGVVEIVLRYHKGYSMEGSTKITHRFLPKELSEIVVLYLWLILPFKQYLESNRSAALLMMPSPLVWSECKTSGKGKKKWDTQRMCEVLEKESTEFLKSKLQFHSYRHVAIGMARKHIRENFFTPTTPEEDKIWDEQSVHESNTAGTIYARGLNSAPGVVASKREGFRKVSQMWQLFLGFKTWAVNGLKRPFSLVDEGQDEEEED